LRKTKLYIVDDHKIVIEGISSFLIGNNEFELMGYATSANQLFDFLEKQQPDILILDVRLPGLQGPHIAKIVLEKYPHIKIIFLSVNTDKDSLNSAIESGGRGYLTKDISEEEFILALQKIKNNENYFSTNIQQVLYKSFANTIKENLTHNKTPLSDREIDVVKLFTEGYSYKEIGKRLSISTRTVETHKKNILEKLELKTTVDLVKYALKEGVISL